MSEFSNTNNLNEQKANSQGESKVMIGVLCFIGLGLVGLLVGYFFYKEQGRNYEWKTFLNGWFGTFAVILGIVFFISVFILTAVASI